MLDPGILTFFDHIPGVLELGCLRSFGIVAFFCHERPVCDDVSALVTHSPGTRKIFQRQDGAEMHQDGTTM